MQQQQSLEPVFLSPTTTPNFFRQSKAALTWVLRTLRTSRTIQTNKKAQAFYHLCTQAKLLTSRAWLLTQWFLSFMRFLPTQNFWLEQGSEASARPITQFQWLFQARLPSLWQVHSHQASRVLSKVRLSTLQPRSLWPFHLVPNPNHATKSFKTFRSFTKLALNIAVVTFARQPALSSRSHLCMNALMTAEQFRSMPMTWPTRVS